MSKKQNSGIKVEVSPSGLRKIIHTIIATNATLPANQQLVPYVMSAPGNGKSTIIADVARETGRHFHDIRLAYSSPVDLMGLPMLSQDEDGKNEMDFAIPAHYPKKPNSVLLLDEFSASSRATQLAALQLLLDKRVGKYEVPDNTLMVLAGNRPIDRAGIERLSSAVINRIVQITLKTDADAWFDWAINSQVDPRVLAFIKFRPDLLSDFNASTWDGDDGFASPRSWTMVSNMLTKGNVDTLPKDLRMAMIQGAIGQGAGTEFGSFIDIYLSLPDIDAMIKDPTSGSIPSEPSVKLAMVAAIAPKTTKENIGNVLTLLDRLPMEFAVLGIKITMRRDASVMATKEGSSWITKNAKNLGA